MPVRARPSGRGLLKGLSHPPLFAFQTRPNRAIIPVAAVAAMGEDDPFATDRRDGCPYVLAEEEIENVHFFGRYDCS